jgi:hypothetical protein
MKAVQKKPQEELRMSSAEFDRIMEQALQVKPEIAKKAAAKKRTAPKRKTPQK